MAFELIYQSIIQTTPLPCAYLHKPSELLTQNSKLDAQISRLTSVDNFQALITTHAQENPVCLLLECIGKQCPLNRIQYPHVRAAFENTVIQTIAGHDTYATKSVYNYVSLGAGGLFQDALLIQGIQKNSQKNMILHLIDPLYEQYIDAASNEYAAIDIQHTLPKNVTHDTTMELYLLHVHEQFRQFFRTIHKPLVQIRCFIYPNVNSYLLHCAKNRTIRAHYGTLVDADCPSIIADMKQLIFYGMQKKGIFFYLDDTGATHQYTP